MERQLPTLDGTSNLGSEWRTFTTMARAFLRDYAKLNLILAEEETDEKTLLMCIGLAVSDVNGTPPGTSYTLLDMINRGYTTIVLYGILVHVMESLMLLETRNHLNWQDGGNVVGLQDRTPLLASHAKYFRDLYSYKLEKKKIADSIETACDVQQAGIPSEYWAVHGYLWV